jgi:methionyl-tRNA synthetase
VLRYVLTANAPETKDNDFTWGDFQTRNNSELVAIFGNFINRVMVLMRKYYDGKVPTPNAYNEADESTRSELATAPHKIAALIEQYKFRAASQEMMQLARLGNKYLADEEPWKLIKTNPDRVATIMHTALQVAAGLAIVSEPFLPYTAQKLRNMLQIESNLDWDSLNGLSLIGGGHQLGEATLLFEKIEDDAITKQLERLTS